MAVETSRLVIEIDARNAEKQAQALNEELINITNSGNKADKQVGVLGTSLKTLAGYMAGIVTVSSAIEKVDAYSGMNNRLKLVTNSQKDLNKAMGDTFAIAQKSYQSWDSVIQVYQRFSDNAKTLGINMDQTARLTETVSKAVAISGASTQAAEAALTQFGQALASGTLRGEELNSVMEQTPALAKAIAQGMGITVGQLRSVAAEGKITSDVLVKSLTAVSASVDEQFAKTDMTIGQSIQLMNNELTKFVGEAGKSSGAASALAESIKTLSLNLSLIADASMIAGIGYITKAIMTKTVAVHESIVASQAQRVANQAQLADELKLAQATVASTATEVANLESKIANNQSTLALLASEKALEVERLKSQMNQIGRTASITRMAELKKVESVITKELAVSEAQLTAVRNAQFQATTKQTAAQLALNNANSIGLKAFNLVGGTVGVLTLGVSALAAGYMYMQHRTAEANAELERQASIASKTKEELQALAGIEKDKSAKDLTVALKAQNEALTESSSKINMQLTAIGRLYKGNADIVKIVNDARNGTISMNQATEQFNKLKINPEIYESFKKNSEELTTNTEKATLTQKALKILGVEVEITGKKAQNAANGVDSNTDSLYANETAAQRAARAQKEYSATLTNRVFDATFSKKLLDSGLSEGKTKALLESANYARKKGVSFTKEMAKESLRVYEMEESVTNTIDARNKAQADARKAERKAESEANRQRNKENREQEKNLKDQLNDRKDIISQYKTDFEYIQQQEQEQLDKINLAGFSDADKAKYIKLAQSAFESERDEYFKHLNLEINKYKWSEEKKLEYTYKINRSIEENSTKTNGVVKEGKLKAIDEAYAFESAQLKLASEERIFQAQQAYLAEEEFIKRRYDLERRAILENSKLQADERKAQLEALDLDTIRGGVRRSTGDTTDKNSQFFKNFNYAPLFKNNQQLLDDDYNKTLEKMGANFKLVQDKNAENHDALLKAEKEFNDAKAQLQAEYNAKVEVTRQKDYESQLSMYGSILSMTSGVFNELTGMVQDYAGENSKSYKTMFAIQKAMAIAQGIVSTELAATQVMADPTALTLAQKQLYAGIIRATGYASVGIIAGQMLAGPNGQGYKNGGYTGNYGVNDVAGVVHGQEYVMDAKTTSRVGTDTLDAIRSGQPVAINGASQQSNVNVPVTIVNQFDDGTVAESMGSDQGQNMVMNVLKRNKTKVKAILGV